MTDDYYSEKNTMKRKYKEAEEDREYEAEVERLIELESYGCSVCRKLPIDHDVHNCQSEQIKVLCLDNIELRVQITLLLKCNNTKFCKSRSTDVIHKCNGCKNKAILENRRVS